MIVAVAICPHPPLMLPDLGGTADAGAPLRQSCLPAVGCLVEARPELIVVIGGADDSGAPAPGARLDLRAFGPFPGRPAPGGRPPQLPLSLGIADHLLEAVSWSGAVERHAIGWLAPAEECRRLGAALAARPESIGLLVMADGSARRGEKAPGYLDEQARPFDAAVVRAITEGDCAALARLDAAEAERLLMRGRAALQVLGEAGSHAGLVPKVELHYLDDPFGVLYFVSSWGIG